VLLESWRGATAAAAPFLVIKKKKKKEEAKEGEAGEEGRQVMRSELTFLRESIAFWKPPRLRPIVLLVRATRR